MSNEFFAERDIEPLTLLSNKDIYEIQNYINNTIGTYINRHKNALVKLYGERDRLAKENENLKRTVEQMNKDIERLKKELKGKANAPVFLTR